MDGKHGLLRAGFQGSISSHHRRLRRQLFRDHSRPQPRWPRMISVIVPAHNEENYLGLTLDAVERQNYPHFEIIVVANGCSDKTAEIAENHCHRLVVLSNKGLGVARNLGAKMARGDLLM